MPEQFPFTAAEVEEVAAQLDASATTTLEERAVLMLNALAVALKQRDRSTSGSLASGA